jgi:hypothetical protein
LFLPQFVKSIKQVVKTVKAWQLINFVFMVSLIYNIRIKLGIFLARQKDILLTSTLI